MLRWRARPEYRDDPPALPREPAGARDPRLRAARLDQLLGLPAPPPPADRRSRQACRRALAGLFSSSTFRRRIWCFAMPRLDESRPFLAVNIAVLTVSDTRGAADDKSGDTLAELIASSPGIASPRAAIVRDDLHQHRRAAAQLDRRSRDRRGDCHRRYRGDRTGCHAGGLPPSLRQGDRRLPARSSAC